MTQDKTTDTTVTKSADTKAPVDKVEPGSQVEQSKLSRVKLTPMADIQESKSEVKLYVDLPGVSTDTLDIRVDQDVLSISGVVDLETPPGLRPTHMDIKAGEFVRKFTLSDELDSSKIDAQLKDGLLKLVIPRSEEHKPRKIEVKAA